MARRRKTSIVSNKMKVPPELNKIIFWIIFLVLWAATLFADTSSSFWNFLTYWLSQSFWSYFKIIVSPAFLLFAFLLFKNWINFHFNLYRLFWFVFYFSSACTLIWYINPNYLAYFNLYGFLVWYLWKETTLLLALVLFVVSLIILFRFSPKKFVKKAISLWPNLSSIKDSLIKDSSVDIKEIKEEKKSKKDEELEKKKKELEEALALLKKEKEELKQNQQKIPLEKIFPKKIEIKKLEKSSSVKDFFTWKKEDDKEFREPNFWNWTLPSLSLLDDRWWEIKIDENEVKRKQLEIEDKLLQFKIEVDMEWYKVWPTVTQYRLKPAEWVKLQKIENLKKDLTLALQAKSIRIQAPIPWLGVVWIETPNSERSIVWLKEVLASTVFNRSKYTIPLAVWKDVNDDIVVWDLTNMPHLLVAWQTASWKSVWVNWFILSMLYKFWPKDLKFIMIDPKRVELSIYNGIPHLLTPVIVNPEKALNALKRWVAEMQKRYDLATSVSAKNIKEYNKKVDSDKKWSYIVIIIDELADLMMSWLKKEVEWCIARIAQMWRAAWIHLIVATQRPSVDVITWLIKANIPTRIAFTVTSQVDSRTILDRAWAEDLLGKWDMLFSPTWTLEPFRVQGVFVDTDEIETVVNQIKLTIDPDVIENMYDPSIVNWKSNLEWSIMEKYEWDQDEDPELVEKAILVVKEARKWSTSLIQRKLWLWYARAAKILDILEELWVVWPSNWSKPREVYVE